MPRPKCTKKAELSPAQNDAVGRVPLTQSGIDLIKKVESEYELDTAGMALLRLAAESISCAERAAAVVQAEGSVFKVPPAMTPRAHPAALLERDHRAAAAASLQKLALQLSD